MLALEVLVFCLLFSTCTGISCQDDQGMNVDWFIIYNIPEIPDSDNELAKAGVAYYYFDPSVQTSRLSTVGIDSPKQALAKTLNQIYSNHKSKNVAYLMYNDEWPIQKPSIGIEAIRKVTSAWTQLAGFGWYKVLLVFRNPQMEVIPGLTMPKSTDSRCCVSLRWLKMAAFKK
ncbi:plancitoxin-1-like [Ptychodera flava]|uniref:plancitoxin-1-like n=1 Tax=Ptychodera flava TaxID=63121 RepID=UPI00396A7E1F